MSLTCLTLLVLCSADAAEDLTCLKPVPGQPTAPTLFYSSLQQQAYAALDRRQATYEQLKTPEQIEAYQKRLRDFFIESLGGLPALSPPPPRSPAGY